MGFGAQDAAAILQALFGPMNQELNNKSEMKRRMQEIKAQYDLKNQYENQQAMDTAKGLLPLLNEGRGQQPIPEFNTEFGKKSARFVDASGRPIDPNSLKSGPTSVPITNLRGETQDYDLEGIRNAINKMNNMPLESPETKQMYANMLNAQKQLEANDLSALQKFKPQQGPTPYTVEQIAAMQRAGTLDDLLKNRQTLADLQEGAKYLPEDQRAIYIAQGMAGSKNPYAAIAASQLNPYKIQNIQSQISNREFDNNLAGNKLDFAKEKQAWFEKVTDRRLSEAERRNAVMEGISQGRLNVAEANLILGQQPTYSTTSYDAQGNSNTVRQKGAPPRASMPSSKPAPSFTYSPQITRK